VSSQSDLDAANQTFWNELCGSELARSIDLRDDSPDQLRRYDEAYMSVYPYLGPYLNFIGADDRVLEIGTGYGTVGRAIIARDAMYFAIDIARGPVAMARLSLERGGQDPAQAVLGSALELPFEDASFDVVIAIGSLHHTGNLPRALAEIRRVLEPGGRALVMVYNARSANRLVTTPLARALARLVPSRRKWLLSRTTFDRNSDGSPAPHTDFTTRPQLRSLCSAFSNVRIDSRNANPISVLGRVLVPRDLLLPTLGRVAGLDLYARLRK
jgi:SAM-dependent methyltransferase